MSTPDSPAKPGALGGAQPASVQSASAARNPAQREIESALNPDAITRPYAAYGIAGALAPAFGNFFQAAIPAAWILFGAFAVAVPVSLVLKRRKSLKGPLSFSVMGLLISGFLLAAQYAPGSENARKLRQEVGVVAAAIPGAVEAQNAVLPVSEKHRETTRFRVAIGRGDSDERGAAARAQLAETEDSAMRAALIGIALRSEEPPVRQAGLLRALAERRGAMLPVNVQPGETAPTIASTLVGAQFAFSRFDADTGVGSGYMHCPGGRRAVNGVAAGGTLTLSGTCYDAASRRYPAYRIIVSPDASLSLVGEAIIEQETAPASVPLL